MTVRVVICLSILFLLASLAQAGYSYYPKPRTFVSGRGGRCGTRKYVCKRGLVCIKRRCFLIVGAGRRCNARRFVICSAGLNCEMGVCKKPLLPVGSPCSTTSQCKKGLTCEANPAGTKICTATVQAGGTCNPTGGLKCVTGFTCINGKCVKPLAGPGETCKVTGDCKKGLSCGPVVGGTALVCIDTQDVNETCDDKGFQCRSGLKCVNGKCVKPLAGPGETCKVTGDCKKGLSCGPVVGGTALVCIDTQDVNETCDDKGFQCRSGLKCVNGKCTKPLAGPGETCKVTGDCKKGLSCGPVVGGTALVCIDTQDVNETCDNKGFQCRSGLKCVNGKCTKPLAGPGETCKVTGDCKKGLSCGPVVGGTALVCIDTQDVNETCDDKGFQCRSGLKCVNGKCTKPLAGKGEPCNTSKDCLPILTCLSTSSGKKCFDIQGEGLSCAGPFEICAKGLKCRRGVCRRRRRKKKKYYYR